MTTSDTGPATRAPAAAPEADLRFDGPVRYGPVPTAGPEAPAADVRAALAGRRYESAAHVVVCEDGRLLGLARIEDVLAADGPTPMRDVMDPDPPVITHGVDEEVAAWKAVRHGESALAVVDDGGRFVGLIPPRRMVEVLLGEHDEAWPGSAATWQAPPRPATPPRSR